MSAARIREINDYLEEIDDMSDVWIGMLYDGLNLRKLARENKSLKYFGVTRMDYALYRDNKRKLRRLLQLEELHLAAWAKAGQDDVSGEE